MLPGGSERTGEIFKVMKRDPDVPNAKTVKLTVMMKLAGWAPDVSKTGTPPYMRCYRRVEAIKKQQKKEKEIKQVAAHLIGSELVL